MADLSAALPARPLDSRRCIHDKRASRTPSASDMSFNEP